MPQERIMLVGGPLSGEVIDWNPEDREYTVVATVENSGIPNIRTGDIPKVLPIPARGMHRYLTQKFDINGTVVLLAYSGLTGVVA